MQTLKSATPPLLMTSHIKIAHLIKGEELYRGEIVNLVSIHLWVHVLFTKTEMKHRSIVVRCVQIV